MFMEPNTQTGTINPAFAGHAALKIQDATGGIQRIFDHLLDIARGNDPSANGHDRIRATRILYDRGFGKVTKTQPQPSSYGSQHGSDAADGASPDRLGQSDRPVANLEQQLDDTLGPPQAPAPPQNEVQAEEPVPSEAEAPRVKPPPNRKTLRDPSCPSWTKLGLDTPIRLDEPGHISDHPDYIPDLVREAQYYILEITGYGAELASILAYIVDPDPEDTAIRACHRITAAQMMLDRVIGAGGPVLTAVEGHDPSLEHAWINMHPADIDSTVPVQKIVQADRDARDFIEDMRKERQDFQPREENGPCDDCRENDPCDYHLAAQELARSDDQILATARGMRNMQIFADRLFIDENGAIRLSPPPPIDDS